MHRRLPLALVVGLSVTAMLPGSALAGGNRREIKRLKAEIVALERKMEDLTAKIIEADQEASRLHDKAAFLGKTDAAPFNSEAKTWDKRADTLRDQRFQLQRQEADLEATINGLESQK